MWEEEWSRTPLTTLKEVQQPADTREAPCVHKCGRMLVF